MTPYEVAMLAAVLCKIDQERRSNFPINTHVLEPKDYFDEAIDLMRKAQTYCLKKNLI